MATRRQVATWIGIVAGICTLAASGYSWYTWAHQPFALAADVREDRILVESSLKSISEQLERQADESHRRYCTGLLNEIVWLQQLQTEEHDTKREQRIIALRARYENECE